MFGRDFLIRIARGVQHVAGELIVGLLLSIAPVSGAHAIDQAPPSVGVAGVEPSMIADRESNITVTFTDNLVPEDSLDRSVADPPLQFDPPIPGVARWAERNVLRYYPDALLLPATEYRLKVKSSLTYLDGKRIKEDRVFTFATPNLQVTDVSYYTEPAEGFMLPHARMVIYLEFNYPIGVKDLKDALSIKGADRAMVGSPKFEIRQEGVPPMVLSPEAMDEYERQGIPKRYSYVITTEPVTLIGEPQRYRLHIAAGLKCQDCGKGLVDDVTQTIIVSPKGHLVVYQVNPRVTGDHYNLQVYLSSELDYAEVKDYVVVEPEMDYLLTTSWSTLTISGNFVPGQSYTLTLKEGLPAKNGEVLEREFSTKVEIPDLPPSIEFTSPGVFLPKSGSGNIELKTTNVDSVLVEVEQVFTNNLVHYLSGGLGRLTYGGRRYWYGDQASMDQYGRRVWYKDVQLNGEPNTPLTTTIGVADILGDTCQGIYVVRVSNENGRSVSDERRVMLTDMGIAARMGDDYLLTWVHSLADAKPIRGAAVQLMSKNNQLMIEGKTDSRGVVTFDKLDALTEEFDPYVITVSKDDDLSFLRFDDCLIPTSDFDVKGRPYITTGYDAFLYTDRGVYRPGDSLHLVTMVRDPKTQVPPPFPFRLIMRDPQGRLVTEMKLNTKDGMLTTVDYAIPDFASTGRYTVVAQIGDDYEIGNATFQVEEFMPDRIKVELTTARDSYMTGDTVVAEVETKFLFGPPAANYEVNGSLTIEGDQFQPMGWSDYVFADRRRSYTKTELPLPDSVLNAEGRCTYKRPLPRDMKAPSALKALAAVLVKEPGGRAVGAYKDLTIHPYGRYIGLNIKLDGYTEPGERVEADVVAVAPDGRATSATGVKARFGRVVYNSVIQEDAEGYYRYVSERTIQPIDSAVIDIGERATTITFTPPDNGEYEIEVTDGPDGHATTGTFYASGWGYVPWSMTNPDRIELDLDQEVYTPGSNAMLQVRAPFSGKLLVTIERERVLETMTLDMEENTASIELPVKSDYTPNVYVTATLIRPATEIASHSPARAFGIVPLITTDEAKKLAITIEAPEVIKPQTKLTVDMQAGHAAGTELTVAAVDAGILQLTEFTTPDPLDFFCGRRRPYLSPYDMYDFVYPEVERATSHLSAAGGARFAAARLRHLSPVTAHRVTSVALWSGRMLTDASGRAQVSFDVPQFNGKLIIMVVGASADRFGSATHETIVRDRVIVQESFPRFVAPNDSLNGFVTLFNNTGADATIDVRLTIDGPLQHAGAAVETIELENNTSGNVIFPLRAGLKPGKVGVAIAASAPGDTAQVEFEMPNRPAQPLKTLSGSGMVIAGQPATIELPGEWLEGTDQYVIRTSSLAAAAFARNIQYLLSYPYGCLEQTTSRLFPLLYFNDLAKFVQPGVFGQTGPDYFIQEGIVRLSYMSLAGGGFEFWPGSRKRHIWASLYACHFVVEARKAGYYVPSDLYSQAIAHPKDVARGKIDDADESDRIYAAFILGKAGKLESRIVNYLQSVLFSELPPFSRYQLAGALAMAGEMDRARELLPRDYQQDLFEPETGGHFSSGLRTDAILLEVLMEIDRNHPLAPAVAHAIMENLREERWYTTQSNAYALMALGMFFKDKELGDYTGTVSIASGESFPIDTSSFRLDRRDLGGKTVTITVTGKGTCYYSWQASGVSSANVAEEFDRGIVVRRSYYDEDGQPLTADSVALGDRVICRITAQSQGKPVQNVVINDLIPAGFAIENPRLKTTPSLAWIPRSDRPLDYQDIRDDRLLLFTGLEPNPQRQMQFYYSLRAVCAGEFVIPPVAAECMYNPVIAGAASSGRLKVIATSR